MSSRISEIRECTGWHFPYRTGASSCPYSPIARPYLYRNSEGYNVSEQSSRRCSKVIVFSASRPKKNSGSNCRPKQPFPTLWRVSWQQSDESRTFQGCVSGVDQHFTAKIGCRSNYLGATLCVCKWVTRSTCTQLLQDATVSHSVSATATSATASRG